MDHFSRFPWNSRGAGAFWHPTPTILAFTLAAFACGGGDPPAKDGEDTTPPTTTLDAHPERVNSSHTAEFSFSGNDDVKLAGFECALDGGDWEPCSSPVVYEALAEGEHTFAVRAVDGANNADPEPATWTWEIDVTPPSKRSLDIVQTVTRALEVTVNLTAEDPNGPVEMRFSGDVAGEGSWKPFATSAIVKLDADSEDGERTIAVEFRDGVGNVSEPVSDTVDLDRTPPTGTIDIVSPVTRENTVVVALTANDRNGPIEMRLSGDLIDETAWRPFDPATTVTLAGGDGLKTVSVEFRDAMGNVSEPTSDTVALDRTAPTGSLGIEASFTNTTGITISLTAEDPNGPIDMRVSGDVIDEVAWKPFDSSVAVTLTDTEGPKTVSAEFRDAAGNVSAPLSDTVILDRTAPTGSIDIASSMTTKQVIDVSLDVSDLNGPIDIRFSGDVVDEGDWRPFEATTSVALTSGEGTKVVTVEFRDAAGNVSEPESDTIERYPPLVGTIDIVQTNTTATAVDVELTVDNTYGPVEMRLFGDIFGEGTWRAFESSVTATLIGNDGLKEIHVVFRDALGRVSDSELDTVALDRLAPGANRWIAASGGYSQTCAIRVDGTLWCSGDNEFGDLGDGTLESRHAPVQEQTGADDWFRVSAGTDHTCALRSNGTLWCWGANERGQIGDGNATDHATSPTQEITLANDWAWVDTGYLSTCAVKRDGTLWCWGANDRGQLGDGTLTGRLAPTQESSRATDWYRVSAGSTHACAIKTDGSLWCWGVNSHGQLGNGGTTDARNPVQESSLSDDWIDVATGIAHTCALKGNGTLWCWGDNPEGRLGDGTTDMRLEPTEVANGSGLWAGVSAGRITSCGVRIDGSLWCWGSNDRGQLGTGSIADRLVPTREATLHNHWTSVTTGTAHTCGIDEDGTLKCWGMDNGRLGDGEASATRLVPIREFSRSTDWEAVTAGANHTCGLRSTGEISCWGSANNGRLGLGSHMPGDWKVIAGGGSHTCGIRNDGTLWCWGNASNGRLGAGTEVGTSRSSPVQEASLSTDWSNVSAGGTHTCAIKTDGSLWCWGNNPSGQLGNDSTTESWEPVQEASQDTLWRSVSAGSNHTCAVKTDGSLWCWGSNANGRLGDNFEDNRRVPTREYTAAADWDSVSAGGSHTCAIKTDGTAWCWGLNGSGRLGVGDSGKRLHATQVVTDSGSWTSISANTSHTCGIKADGHLYCWGNGANGRLGNSFTVNANSPREEWTGASDWVEVTTGDTHTCASKSNGTIHCWGRNQAGQLGADRNPLIPESIVREPEIEVPSTVTGVDVTLTLRAYDVHPPVKMRLDGDITDAFKGEWIDFASETNVTLATGSGAKTVTVQFRDELGNTSETFSGLTTLE